MCPLCTVKQIHCTHTPTDYAEMDAWLAEMERKMVADIHANWDRQAPPVVSGPSHAGVALDTDMGFMPF